MITEITRRQLLALPIVGRPEGTRIKLAHQHISMAQAGTICWIALECARMARDIREANRHCR